MEDRRIWLVLAGVPVIGLAAWFALGPAVGVVAAVFAAVGAAVLIRTVNAANDQDGDPATFVLHSDPNQWLERTSLGLAALPRHQVSAVGRDAIQVCRSGVSVGRILIVVLLFPIGLLALIGAGSRTGTIRVDSGSSPPQVRLNGSFSGKARSYLRDQKRHELDLPVSGSSPEGAR